jgi:L,D-transpeptidase YcbB
MKNLIIIIAAFCLLQSCKFSDNNNTASSDSSAVYRDESITAENAYSDLFLDSAAVNSFIQTQKLDDSTAQMLRNFYTVRNNQFAWFTSQGLTEQGRSFWSLYTNGGDSASNSSNDKALREQMDSLIQKDSIQIAHTDSNYIRAELALTEQLVRYAGKSNGIVNRNNLYSLVPRKKTDPLELADSLLNKQKDSSAFAGNKTYVAMKQQLATYYNAAKNGGWQSIATGAGLKKGSASAAVTALKKRLQATNDYAAGDTSNVFSDSLVAAIKDVQQRHGLAPTGAVNDSLVQALNVPAQERLQQVLLNMNRLAWMPPAIEGNRIEVNIPSQMLYAYEGNTKVFEMPVIVGKEATSTVAFNGNINKIVFNPSWNIPESIVKNEIMPAMKKDPNYLKKKNMEIVSQNDSVPVIKQLPGKDNALGSVKFLFPNSFDIYLHDTPDKSLFKQKNRALSHGCIRVADAEKLAAYLLRSHSEWTPAKVREAMNSNKEQTITVSNEPVNISYLSAWVDGTGKLNFRNDVYGRDKDVMARLFTIVPSQDVAVGSIDSTNAKKDSTNKNTAKRK